MKRKVTSSVSKLILAAFHDGFEVFFDRHDLRTREEWRTQLAWAVREAEVLMACVSKPYFESDFCLWEFQEYEVKPTGPDTGEGLVRSRSEELLLRL